MCNIELIFLCLVTPHSIKVTSYDRLAYETWCCFGLICKSGCICIVLGSGIVQYSSSSLLVILVLFSVCF